MAIYGQPYIGSYTATHRFQTLDHNPYILHPTPYNRVQGLRLRVSGLGSRVSGLGVTTRKLIGLGCRGDSLEKPPDLDPFFDDLTRSKSAKELKEHLGMRVL